MSDGTLLCEYIKRAERELNAKDYTAMIVFLEAATAVARMMKRDRETRAN